MTDGRAVMGSGPYRLAVFDEGTGHYAYTANPGYFLGDPHVRRIEFATPPDALAALRRAEVDAISTTGEGVHANGAIPPGEDRPYDTITAPGEWVRALHLNLAAGYPFADRRFRHALAYAIDRVELVKRLLGGQGEPASMGGLAPSHPFTPQDLPTYECDGARAGALLDEIGLRDVDGDDWRELPGGGRFCVELQTTPGASADAAALISRQLASVGIEVGVVTLALPEAEAASAAGRYEMALVGYGGLGSDADLLRLRLSSRSGVSMWASVHGWDNPLFEDLAAEQRVTVDPTRRHRLIQEMQRVVAADVPMIPLYVPSRAILYDPLVFDALYFTPGGVAGAYPGPFNKHAFITGRRQGFAPTNPVPGLPDHRALPWHGCPASASI